MDVDDLMANASDLTDHEFERKLNKLVRDNYRYKNLDQKNRETIKELFKKYKKKIREGVGISSSRIRDEMYRLNRDKQKKDLSEEDLKDIKEILSMFKK